MKKKSFCKNITYKNFQIPHFKPAAKNCIYNNPGRQTQDKTRSKNNAFRHILFFFFAQRVTPPFSERHHRYLGFPYIIISTHASDDIKRCISAIINRETYYSISTHISQNSQIVQMIYNNILLRVSRFALFSSERKKEKKKYKK